VGKITSIEFTHASTRFYLLLCTCQGDYSRLYYSLFVESMIRIFHHDITRHLRTFVPWIYIWIMIVRQLSPFIIANCASQPRAAFKRKFRNERKANFVDIKRSLLDRICRNTYAWYDSNLFIFMSLASLTSEVNETPFLFRDKIWMRRVSS